MTSVFDVAKFIIESAGGESDMTNMKLNKLLYYAQGTHLARTGQPLFNDTIEAWPYGPVIPTVYQQYKEFGGSPIPMQQSFVEPSFSQDEADSILDVVREYGKFTAFHLRDKTHAPGTPWAETPQSHVITKNLILQYFSQREEAPRWTFDVSRIPTVGFRDSDGLLVLPADDDWGECDEM
jgi:uncharacterized phage-associated protein